MKSKIEWTERTWNVSTGCNKVSPGCANCYAERMAKRQKAMGNYPEGFKFTLRYERFNQPLHWKKPSIIFINSMSDLFHKDFPFDEIDKVFEVIKKTPYHTYQILTKRAERMYGYFHSRGPAPGNAWIGVTVEDQERAIERIPYLLQIPGPVRFLSCEPLLGPLDIPSIVAGHVVSGKQSYGINWIIAGGESGPKARPVNPEWIKGLRDLCKNSKVGFFFKQWGEYNEQGERVGKRNAGKLLDNREYVNWPTGIHYGKGMGYNEIK